MKRTNLILFICLLLLPVAARGEDNGIEMLPEEPPATNELNAQPLELPPDQQPPSESAAEPAPEPTPAPVAEPPRRRAEKSPPSDKDEDSDTLGWVHHKLPPKHQHYWLLYFELGALGVVHKSGGSYVIGPWLAWRPTLPLHKRVQLRGSLQAAFLKNGDATAQFFSATSFEGWLAVAIDHGWLEAGGGMQSWSGDNGGSHPVASANIAAPFKKDYLRVLDRAVIGFSYFFVPGNPVIEVKLGVGLAF